MRIENVKTALMVLWPLAVGVLGYATGVASVAGWAVLLVLACAPPLVVLKFWGVPSQSMSESIQKVLK